MQAGGPPCWLWCLNSFVFLSQGGAAVTRLSSLVCWQSHSRERGLSRKILACRVRQIKPRMWVMTRLWKLYKGIQEERHRKERAGSRHECCPDSDEVKTRLILMLCDPPLCNTGDPEVDVVCLQFCSEVWIQSCTKWCFCGFCAEKWQYLTESKNAAGVFS